MKNRVKTIAAALVIATITFAFTTIEDGKKEVKIESSQVTWKGYKVTGSHAGSIGLKQGSLDFKDGKLTGGEFIIDMTSIVNTDMEGEYKAKLEGHLKSDDFFSTQNHTAANLNITKVEGRDGKYSVTGDLTIKDITKSITFAMKVSDNSANAKLKIDRTEFDIKYKSASFFENLKDKAILDDFDLNVNLAF